MTRALRTIRRGATPALALALIAGCARLIGLDDVSYTAAPADAASLPADAAVPLTVARIGSIAIGASSACVITNDDRSLWCIGRVSDGENMRLPGSSDVDCRGDTSSLGKGTWRFERLPIASRVDHVALSLRARCAILQGKVRCWGGNRVGELGHAPATAGDVDCGTDSCNLVPQEPVGLPSGATFVEIAAGNRTFCARSGEGSVYCWGDNATGQAGQSPTSLWAAPGAIDLAGSKASALAMGLGTACVAVEPVGAEAGVRCWGDNSSGAVGAEAGVAVSRPALVPSTISLTARELDVGRLGGCLLINSGNTRPFCWGVSTSGLLGSPDASGSKFLSTVPVGGQYLHLGEFGALVRVPSDAGQSVWTWGEGRRGGLASGALTDGAAVEPERRPLLDGVSLVAFGLEENGMAVRGTDLLAWGPNTCGQLGHAPGEAGDLVCERNDPCNPSPAVLPLR